MDYKEDLLSDNVSDVSDSVSEAQVLIWRTLIHLVKPNCVLYQKKLKSYSKKFNKSLMWNNIGASLVPPMIGIVAEKEFYRLRQKFGKERRKVLQSQIRSGGDANHVSYKSNWELYDDLLFLIDHIQPRRTRTNYQRPPLTQGSVPQTLQHVKLTSSVSPSSLLTCTSPLSISDESRELWNSDQYGSVAVNNKNRMTVVLLNGKHPVVLYTGGLLYTLKQDKTAKRSSTEDEKPKSVQYATASSPSNSFTANISLTSTPKASTSILKPMASTITPQKQTPSPDIVKKRKRGTIRDEIETVMLEYFKNNSLLATTLETALKAQTLTPVSIPTALQLPTDGITPAIQGMMGSIALGLAKVPEECQMDCLISVLSCIKNFTKK